MEELLFTSDATDVLGVSSGRLNELAEGLAIVPLRTTAGALWSRADLRRMAWKLAAIGTEVEKESARFALKALKDE